MAGYEYLVDNPKFYDTQVSLIITADWAGFALDTSASFIKKDSITTYGINLESQSSVGFIVHAPVGGPVKSGARVE